MPKKDPGNIRITPQFFHILLAVAGDPMHGYAIMQDVRERTRGDIKLGPGSLYWALKRLRDAGLIDEVGSDDPRRRTYRLTPAGRRLMRAETAKLLTIVETARARRLAGR